MKVWLPAIRGNSGTDVFTRRLSQALQRRGIDTEITWFSTCYQFAPFLLRRAPAPRGTTVVHANSWNAFAFKRPGTPLLVTEHHCVLDPGYRSYKSFAQRLFHETVIRRFEIASFQVASAITTVSQFTASSLANTLGIRSVQVIHNWINTKTFTPSADPTRLQNRCFRLLFVGNLSRRKGADLLAPIMRRLGATFQLSFTSGLRNSRRISTANNMIPLGQLTEERDLIEAYHQCDAVLLPSRFEGFGYVALEAMACGKPVIASNTSSLPEVVEHEVTGILCPPDDVGAFVAACRRLAENPELCARYGAAGRRRTEELFSEERIIPQYIALYEKLAGGR